MIERLEDRVLFAASTLPRPDHVVVLIEEDHSYTQLFGSNGLASLVIWPVMVPHLQTQAPRLHTLEERSASFTHAYSIGHRNAVDYNAIFSGVQITIRQNPAPASLSAPNVASELNAAGLSFGGYSESLPKTGFTGTKSGDYTRAHNPWVQYSNVPASQNMPFSKFPGDYRKLPTVSYVVPNESNNMHSGQVIEADNWYENNIAPYAKWAISHNSLLIVTWDESHQGNDQIPTMFYGPMVRPGHYSERITQANMLATIEAMYGLQPTGASALASPITDVFRTSST